MSCRRLSLGPALQSRRLFMVETLPSLEQVVLAALRTRDPLHCSKAKDRAHIYEHLSRALAPTLYGITEPGGPQPGTTQLKAQQVLELGSDEPGVVKVSRGIYLLDVQTAMADAASELMTGVPLEGLR